MIRHASAPLDDRPVQPLERGGDHARVALREGDAEHALALQHRRDRRGAAQVEHRNLAHAVAAAQLADVEIERVQLGALALEDLDPGLQHAGDPRDRGVALGAAAADVDADPCRLTFRKLGHADDLLPSARRQPVTGTLGPLVQRRRKARSGSAARACSKLLGGDPGGRVHALTTRTHCPVLGALVALPRQHPQAVACGLRDGSAARDRGLSLRHAHARRPSGLSSTLSRPSTQMTASCAPGRLCKPEDMAM